MSEIDRSQYKAPEGLDTSFAAMRERLVVLQPSLNALMTKALQLFDDVFPQALHPAVDTECPVYAVASANWCPVECIPMGRELTVVLDNEKWVRVFRTSQGAPNSFPRQRLWVWRPDGDVSRKIDVIRSHSPSRTEYPYDIETSDHSASGGHLGFVGGATYYEQEPFIDEANKALDHAQEIATQHGFLIPKSAE